MFFSQTSRKPANSLASATSIALWNRYHASCPSLSSSAVRKVQWPSTGSNRFSVPALQSACRYSWSGVTAQRWVFAQVYSRSAVQDAGIWNCVRQRLSTTRTGGTEAFRDQQHREFFCSTRKSVVPRSGSSFTSYASHKPCSSGARISHQHKTKIMPTNGISPAATMIDQRRVTDACRASEK